MTNTIFVEQKKLIEEFLEMYKFNVTTEEYGEEALFISIRRTNKQIDMKIEKNENFTWDISYMAAEDEEPTKVTIEKISEIGPYFYKTI